MFRFSTFSETEHDKSHDTHLVQRGPGPKMQVENSPQKPIWPGLADLRRSLATVFA